MIKAGFIAGGRTESNIDELYTEIVLGALEYGSTIDELYTEIVVGAPEYGSTIDELYAEISFASSL